jgi:hypothetical protein
LQFGRAWNIAGLIHAVEFMECAGTAGSDTLEVEYRIGPLDISDGDGKEVIAHFETDLVSGDEFATDVNGMQACPHPRSSAVCVSLLSVFSPASLECVMAHHQQQCKFVRVAEVWL